ncbi:MAG: hypothetical protein HY716_00610 [Planctomycetes bacterium]|nr:hypothetical protein [Planctomycetota bacterium]
MIAFLMFWTLQAQEPEDAACLRCHEDQATAAVGSVHANADVGCVACHGADDVVNGRHRYLPGFRPSRLRAVAQDCGRCHEAVFQSFQGTPHFASAARNPSELRLRSTCSACHGHHDTPKANRNAIQATCLGCHEASDLRPAQAVFVKLDLLDESLRRLGARVHALERRPGISVRASKEVLAAGEDHRRELRIAQHGLEWDALSARTDEAFGKSEQAYNSLDRRERAFAARRALGLAAFLLLLGTCAVLIHLRVRS